RPTDEALFGIFGPAYYRRPDRLEQRAVDPGQKHDLIVDFGEFFQVSRVEDVALGIFNDIPNRIAKPAQFIPVLLIILDIRMAGGQGFFKACAYFELGQLESEKCSEQSTCNH